MTPQAPVQTGNLAPYPILSYTVQAGDVGKTISLPLYKCQQPTDSYEVDTLQFLVAPSDIGVASIFLDGNQCGILTGSSTYGPIGLQQGNQLRVDIPNISAADVGQLIAVVVTGYFSTVRPDPWPVPVSGGLGSPPSSAGGGGVQPVAIASPLDSDGAVLTGVAPAATSAQTSVAVAAASFAVKAANANRRMLMVVNDNAPGAATVFLTYGAGPATAANYTVALVPGAYWEMPDPPFTGAISAIGTGATGNLRVTELT